MIARFLKNHLLISSVLLLAACSGGNVTVGVNIPDLSPELFSEPVTSMGVISGLNSVAVNDVLYDTHAATVVLNGRTRSIHDLAPGQYVQVEGMIYAPGFEGTASHINVDANVIGSIDAINPTIDQLVVLGQVISTGPQTVFGPGIDPASFAGLSVGSDVQVSGFPTANGRIAATRIELDPGITATQVIGSVSGLDIANMLFHIGDLTIDYGNTIMIDLPGGTPSNGMFLVARGGPVIDIMRVTELTSIHSSGRREPHERTFVEGFITRFHTSTNFDVNGYRVSTDSRTRFKNGSPEDLQLNSQVRIYGRVHADRLTIIADEVDFARVLSPATTITYDLQDFTAVSVTDVFDVTVEQASEYSVEVTIDANAVNNLDVQLSNNTLHVGLQSGNINVDTVEAVVRLPFLDHVAMNGVITTSLSGFNQQQLSATVGGVSVLQGASMAVTNLNARIFGVSDLRFGDISPLSIANIEISDVSKATLNMGVGSTLTGSVTGTSQLLYYGTNVSIDVVTSPTSSLTKLGETR